MAGVRRHGESHEVRLPFILRSTMPIHHNLHDFVERRRWPHHDTEEDRRVLRVQLEDELAHDAKIRAATADTPKEIFVLCCVRCEDAAISRDDGSLQRR